MHMQEHQEGVVGVLSCFFHVRCSNLYLPQVWESLGRNQPKIAKKVKTSESSIKTGAGSMHIAKMCHSPGLPYAVASGDGVCSAPTSDEAAKGSVATTTRYFSKVVSSQCWDETIEYPKISKEKTSNTTSRQYIQFGGLIAATMLSITWRKCQPR